MRFLGECKVGLIFIVFFICLSCAREAYNISYMGVIVDEETNCPLPLTTVQSFCFYQQNIDESATQQLFTRTDSLGQFKLRFDKGYKISMIISAEDYMDKSLQFKPLTALIPDTIYLKRKLVLQSSTATRSIETP